MPVRAATVISRASLVKSCPRLASVAPLARLIVDHFECPDMDKTPDRAENFKVPEYTTGLVDGWYGPVQLKTIHGSFEMAVTTS